MKIYSINIDNLSIRLPNEKKYGGMKYFPISKGDILFIDNHKYSNFGDMITKTKNIKFDPPIQLQLKEHKNNTEYPNSAFLDDGPIHMTIDECNPFDMRYRPRTPCYCAFCLNVVTDITLQYSRENKLKEILI